MTKTDEAWADEAVADLERMGIDAFADTLWADLVAARDAAGATGTAPATVVRRLVIRKTILVEVFGRVAQDALATFDGPQH